MDELRDDITDQIDEAVAVLKRGGVVAFPTETSYGLGALIDKPQALKKIFFIKNRPSYKPLLVLIPDRSFLNRLVSRVSDEARLLMDNFWPGPLTLLFPAMSDLDKALVADTGKIGIRISSDIIAIELCKRCNSAITATSANLSGKSPCMSYEEIKKDLIPRGLDFVINKGVIKSGPPSTILDVSVSPPLLVRSGAIEINKIKKVVDIVTK